jgi:AcrR family transcriptional regulator
MSRVVSRRGGLVSDVEAKVEPTRKRRSRLSRDLVLAAAMKLADEGGIEALTMRRLARALGVETMTTYYHTANKEDVLAGIVDLAVEEMEPPAPGGDWRAAVRTSAISTHDVLGRHPWAADLLMSSTHLSSARLRQMEALLSCLRAAGFAGALTDHAYHAIDIYVHGYGLWEARFASTVQVPLADLATSVLSEMSIEEYPQVADHIAFHFRPPNGKPVRTFEFGLDLLLDGLERARSATR